MNRPGRLGSTIGSTIGSILVPFLWGDTLYIPPLPPDFGKKKNRGRPTTLRRREPNEKELKEKKKRRGRMQKMKRQQDTVRCSKCGGQGHNSGTCNEPPYNVDDSSANKENGKYGRKSGHAENSEKPVRAKRKKKDKETSTDEPRMEPPNLVKKRSIDEEDDDIEKILTRQSQLTQEVNPYLTAPLPTLQGPTMYQQLHMGMQTARPVAPHHQPAHLVPLPPPQMPSRVNVRAPPPFTGAQFHFRAPAPKMSETRKNIIVDSGGLKYLDLSDQAVSSSVNGKKKAC